MIDNQLVLGNIGWESIHPMVFDCVEIEALSLMSNNLKEIPGDIQKLKNLQRLRLNNNQLKTLPPEIAFLRKLTWLELWGNPIETFPEEILQMPNLQTIRLDGIGNASTAHRRFAAWSYAMSEVEKAATLNGNIRITPRKYRHSEIKAFHNFQGDS